MNQESTLVKSMRDASSYLPQEWADDAARRRKVGGPEEIVFKIKPEIAPEQVRVACAAATQTFIAGLRCDGLTAPWVIDQPMNRQIFDTYVEPRPDRNGLRQAQGPSQAHRRTDNRRALESHR
jgi:hypothetical protein